MKPSLQVRLSQHLALTPQLQRQAFGQVARADAGRVQTLQPHQRALLALEQLFAVERVTGVGQTLGDVGQSVGQIAVGI